MWQDCVGSQSFPITISEPNGNTDVMTDYAEALVEDLRATIAKSGGHFVVATTSLP